MDTIKFVVSAMHRRQAKLFDPLTGVQVCKHMKADRKTQQLSNDNDTPLIHTT